VTVATSIPDAVAESVATTTLVDFVKTDGLLLGLTGPAGSGKDYVYQRLSAMFPHQVERVALADAVRAEIEHELGTRIDVLYEKPTGRTVRRLLQWWGTDFRRAENPEHWVDLTAPLIRLAWRQGFSLVCVTDVRFHNEADMIHDLGGKVAAVNARDAVRAERLGELPPPHQSEDIDYEPDLWIDNPGPVAADQATLKYLAPLGANPACVKCRGLRPHPWHDDGTPFPPHDDYPNPAPQI